jgi:hypothetical protein
MPRIRASPAARAEVSQEKGSGNSEIVTQEMGRNCGAVSQFDVEDLSTEKIGAGQRNLKRWDRSVAETT